ncbi:MAG: cohesin domain-containing protein, partial [Bacteroidota bacterium]
MLHRTLRRILMLVSFVLLGATGARGQTIPVSIPDTTAQKGDTLLIPIRITSLTVSDSVYSGHMSLMYDAGVVDIFGIETAGTMAASPVSALYNTATRELAFASANIITGSGVFVYLKTRVRETPTRDTTTIWFPETIFNEGNRNISLNDGKLRILKMTVAPKSPPTLLVVGDSLQFFVSGDQILPLSWTSSDTSVGKIDTTGKFKAKATGQAKVYVEDSRGLMDSTNLFPVYPVQAASLTVSAHDTSHTQTLEFNLPIYVTNVTGLGIIASEFTMNFSSTRLQAISVIQAGTMTDSWSSPAYNIVSGQIDVVLAGIEELVGSGILVYVRMRVLPAASGGSTVSFSNVLFNENLTANTISATFTPIAAPTVVVAPASAQVVRNDTLSFFVTSGGTPPYVWSSANPTVASINPSTG